MLCILSFGKHSLSEGIFLPMPVDVFTELHFLFCKQHTKSALGKYLQKPWQGQCQLCPVLPAGPRGTCSPEQWVPAINPLWPDLFMFWLQIAVCTQHQLGFFSPNCLKLPENFLLSKEIKMTTLVSLPPPPPNLLGTYKITLLVEFLQWWYIVISCSHTWWFNTPCWLWEKI